jgi:hypothetical protein
MSNASDMAIALADKMLFEALMAQFYGTISFSFKAGKIVLIRKEETLVPNAEALFSMQGDKDDR